MFESGLDLREFVSPGFHPYWERALASPASQVEWVLAYPGDSVAEDMAAHPARFTGFRLILAANEGRLYQRLATPQVSLARANKRRRPPGTVTARTASTRHLAAAQRRAT
jgi:hypothetical protein